MEKLQKDGPAIFVQHCTKQMKFSIKDIGHIYWRNS